MKRVLVLVLIISMVLISCGGAKPSGPPEVLAADFAQRLSEQMEPINPRTEFQPNDTVYLSVKLKGSPKKGVVSARYYHKDSEITRASVDLEQSRKESGNLIVLGGNTLVGFTLTPDSPFPAGDEYRADVYMDDAKVGSYKFSIAGAAPAPTQVTKAEPAPTKVTKAEPAPTKVTKEEPAPTKVPEAAPSGAVSTLEDLKSAVIQIEASGSFIHPEFGQVFNIAGRGSGFIIDPSGIAVTNNHVATGAALLRVWVGGATDPLNARLLGVSECSDLAVIDIEGEGFPYLEWFDGDIKVGLEVYAAGFPLGDPEYTLTRGIVAKEKASGETNWASVDSVIEHDATTNPGNSGGPLVTKDAQVVGINYAGSSAINQFRSISRQEAMPVVEKLRTGEDVNSIGVNGEAVNNGEGISGIWVSSVASGSPADDAGVKGGDIILKLEGLVLSVDGTMSDYCDVLRTHGADRTLAIEVLRFATQEVLEGQLNGRELTQKFSFRQQGQEGGGGGSSGGGGGGGGGGGSTGYANYVIVNDESGALKMAVPAEWNDVNGSAWVIDEEIVGGAIAASSDLEAFQGTWTVPGVFMGASSSLAAKFTEEQILDTLALEGECSERQRSQYSDPLYTGHYDYYKGCGEQGAHFIMLAAAPEGRAFTILLQVQVVSDADLEATDKILESFEVVGALPSG